VFEHSVVPGATPGETVEEVAARASRVLRDVEPMLHRGDVALVGHGHHHEDRVVKEWSRRR
jgi:broad specificity phosphatase PhoE